MIAKKAETNGWSGIGVRADHLSTFASFFFFFLQSTVYN